MKIIVKVTDRSNNAQKGLSVYLHDVTKLSVGSYESGIKLGDGVTDTSGIATLSYTKSSKIKKIAFIVRRKGEDKILMTSKGWITSTLKNGQTITLKLASVLRSLDEATDEPVLGEGALKLKRFVERVEVEKVLADSTVSGLKPLIKSQHVNKKKTKKEGIAQAGNIFAPKLRLGEKDFAASVFKKDQDGIVKAKPEDVVKQTRDTGLDRMNKHKNNRRGIIVRESERFTKAELKNFIKEQGSDPDAVRELLFPNKPPQSVRVENALIDCYVGKHQKLIDEALPDDANDNESSTTVSAVSAMTVDELGSIDDRIEKIVNETQQNSLLKRPDIDDVNQSLKEKELSNGPADTTAYYDFHAMQIAWGDVWDSVFDQDAFDSVASLYEDIVSIVPEESVRADLSDVENLDDFLSYISGAINAVTDSIEFAPEVIGWLPEVENAAHHLMPRDAEYVQFLWTVDAHANYFGPANPDATFKELFPRTVDEEESAHIWWPVEWEPTITLDEIVRTKWGVNVAKQFLEKRENDSFDRVRNLITSLQKYIVEPYKFDVFVPNSYNFGVMTTYRQKWIPQGFQAGELVSTIPMAPGEKRSLETRIINKKEQSRSDIRSDSSTDNRESTSTSRMTSSIVDKAVTNMRADADVGYNFDAEVQYIEANASFGFDQGADSSRNKEEYREAVRKSAQEYKDERKVEVKTSSSQEIQTTAMTEISNPNNELTVTYLFYELQQRFKVSEKLHDVFPVIMVAFDVPKPSEITEAWLVTHSWVIRKVLLDETLLKPLLSLGKSFTGDEISVEIKKRQWLAQLSVVEQLKRNLNVNVSELNEVRDDILDSMAGSGDPEDAPKRLRKMIKENMKNDLLNNADYNAALKALEWVESDISDSTAELRQASTALERATETYVLALEESYNRKVAIDNLKAHVKQNIFHYMQAIWKHEHPDQRYMRLYDLQIQWPEYSGDVRYRAPTTVPHANNAMNGLPSSVPSHDVIGTVVFPPAVMGEKTRPLYEVADIDRVIGFKGNYAIFKLRENNPLTDYMSQDFLDTEFGIYDPDPEGEVLTVDEALDIAHCAWKAEGVTGPDKTKIKNWLLESIKIAKRKEQEIVVPSGELFIEALPGKHTLLEDFKLRHREADAKKAAAEAQISQIEALRRAKLLQEGDYSDPKISKSVHIVGNTENVIVDTE